MHRPLRERLHRLEPYRALVARRNALAEPPAELRLVSAGEGEMATKGPPTSRDGILVGRAGVVGNLQPTLALTGITQDIDIRTLVESVVKRLCAWRREEVVDVGEALAGR